MSNVLSTHCFGTPADVEATAVRIRTALTVVGQPFLGAGTCDARRGLPPDRRTIAMVCAAYAANVMENGAARRRLGRRYAKRCG